MKNNVPLIQDKAEKPKFIRPELLLHPNVPKPLHGTNPRSILGKEWWDEQRQIAYKKNNYCCWACGVHKSEAKKHQWLEAHECYYINYKKGEAKLTEIVALCHYCHNYIHSGRMKMMLDKKEISFGLYLDVRNHGDMLIGKIKNENKARRLFANEYPPTKVAGWSKWHIIINKKKYMSKFTDVSSWREHYYNSKNKE